MEEVLLHLTVSREGALGSVKGFQPGSRGLSSFYLTQWVMWNDTRTLLEQPGSCVSDLLSIFFFPLGWTTTSGAFGVDVRGSVRIKDRQDTVAHFFRYTQRLPG